ncbi:ParA family protein [Prescottella equi]
MHPTSHPAATPDTSIDGEDRWARVTALYSRKGGVGTTTTVTHLVRAAARAGHHVLVIESDNIGTLSLSLIRDPFTGEPAPSAPPAGPGPGLGLGERACPDTLRALLQYTRFDTVKLLPNAVSALGFDPLHTVHDVVEIREYLTMLREDFDWIVIDTPSGPITPYVNNCLTAADDVVLVAEPNTPAYIALGLDQLHLAHTLHKLTRGYTPHLRGVIINRIPARDTSSRTNNAITAITDNAPALTPQLPYRSAIGNAPLERWDLDQFPGTASLQKLYDQLYAQINPTQPI